MLSNNEVLNFNNLTPIKRKRNFDNLKQMCSTPKQSMNNIGIAFDNHGLDIKSVSPKFYHNKENIHIKMDGIMEIKSIAELNNEQQNPYEIIRKPSKKKKRFTVDNCFENPALNINGPDNEPINPYEIKRPLSKNLEEENHCFSNPGLVIRSNDSTKVLNAFEVIRPNDVKNSTGNTLSIGLPFTPNIQRKINFNDLPKTLLTPSGLLAKNLIIDSDLEEDNQRNLSIIKEEPLNISEELDCYQLQLENSINEKKNKNEKWLPTSEQIKKQSNDSEKEETKDIPKVVLDSTYTVLEKIPEEVEEENDVDTVVVDEDNDIQYEEVDDSFDDFKEPAVSNFTRTYRRGMRSVKNVEKENVEKSNNNEHFSKLIRKSLRKFIHPKHKNVNLNKPNNNADIKESNNFITAIRQSFRKKHKPDNEMEMQKTNKNDISIIDTSEKRKIFRQPEEDALLGNSKKTLHPGSFIRSSFRRSTREKKFS